MKDLLVVVDFQKDFVTGSLGFEDAVKLRPYIKSLIEDFQAKGNDIVYTMDTHGENYLHLQEGQMLPVEHCIKGTEGWELDESIKDLVREQDMIFEKPTFPSLELGKYLEGKDYFSVRFVGVVSNICVISNAVIAKAALPEAVIEIDKKGIASNDPELEQKCLDICKNLQMMVI